MLSVIIPTLGRAESLARLLRALGSQTLRDIEIIVVDQNPPGFLEARLPRQLLMQARQIQMKEQNASAARNAGFLSSSGSLILFLDDDMVPDPGFCAKGAAILSTHEEVKCLFALIYEDSAELDAIRAVGPADVTWSSRALGLSQRGIPSWYQKRNMTGRRIPGTEIYGIKDYRSGATFFTRSFFARSGGFDEMLFRYARTAEDQELFTRMRYRGMQMWFARDLTVFHDESQPGGCDLRTVDYWVTREKCVKSWAYRHRIHNKAIGRIGVRGMLSLMRSAFLNSSLLRSSLRNTLRQIALLRMAVEDSRQYLEPYIASYKSVRSVDHLNFSITDDGRQER